MIKIRFIALLIMSGSLPALKAQVTSAIDSNYIFSGYTEKLAEFRKMPVLPNAIVFVGNSLTDAGRWNDILPELPVLNRGISGDISYGVLARLDEITRHQPEKVFLMIGVNDLKRGIPTTHIIENYTRIVRKVKQQSPITRVYLHSVLPVNPAKLIASFKAVKNDDIQLLNDGLKRISQTQNGVYFVDLHTILADRLGNLRAEITPDGIHLEVAAYVELVDYLKKIEVL
ncbi:GDSL-type esterase/lipase family protein [Sphingobacterium gobiense]|uniref:GDSL family lipase n=1 Tax=Sphingobacterium gobiense TaxID=1382456 RepID=A0A2S9JIA8_9SPHI|nr:GDSL-type esterase/lipase family protein [Sphingobacterium gobiense]PRD52731.1 GDSL family lipase [Sphingobacterium gobiense]